MFSNYRDSDSRPPSGDITGRTQFENWVCVQLPLSLPYINQFSAVSESAREAKSDYLLA